ncbi:uncharacterized protein HD556DRAFT_300387 [Suillus plorans]|uniref:Uncharacterized protein n=1 Tax=Suillus plorans TaxID=116603 RepID=A0A9P7AU20_9AGAM|nr:uncharacterized protein HD556DRAFT_300387 [Suillus plorans]KAG1796408.1 hypothetical protein HD556DRAFT_300387 [Suillus plorans]
MPESTTPLHMSSHFSLFEDDCVESDATNSATDPEDEHTLTTLGEPSLSQEEETLGWVPNDIHHLNCLCLKAKYRSAQDSPQHSARKFWDPLTCSLGSTSFPPAEYFKRYRLQRAEKFQHAQAAAAEAETRSRAADSGESTSNHSIASYDYESEQLVSEAPEPVEEWRPLRPESPK